MNDNFQKLNNFFQTDLHIKQLISSLFPNPADRLNKSALFKYVDRLEDSLDKIEISFNRIINTYFSSDLKKYIEVVFDYYHQEINSCGYDYDKLENAFKKIFVSMSPELIDITNNEIKGYYMLSGVEKPLAKATSISEILHIFHSYVLNNENILQSCNLLKQKAETRLYGYPSQIAENIFNSLDDYFSDSPKIIVSLNETHILMMLRDFGHATTLDINIENDEAWIEYFIPKVCNCLMVNELPGVRKVDKSSNWTKGTLRVKVSELGKYLNNFIKMIPTDDEMFIKGGIVYEERTTR